MEQPPLSLGKLSGIDRSDGPPPETQAGAPLRPWTLPNAIGFLRLGMLVAFLVLALRSDHGTDALPAALYTAVAWGDQLDGFVARVTGQYSRLGALLDPALDRALIISGVIVTWRFDLLPRWALAVLVAREALMLALGPIWGASRPRPADHDARALGGLADDGGDRVRDLRGPGARQDPAVRRRRDDARGHRAIRTPSLDLSLKETVCSAARAGSSRTATFPPRSG